MCIAKKILFFPLQYKTSYAKLLFLSILFNISVRCHRENEKKNLFSLFFCLFENFIQMNQVKRYLPYVYEELAWALSD